jgi:GAF domain-containing protein
MIFGGGASARREARRISLELELSELQSRRRTVAELQASVMEDQALLARALATLTPQLDWEQAADLVRQLCFRPFELSAFLVARMDWEQGWLHFPYFFEVGRTRYEPPRQLSDQPGLTGRALLQNAPLYLSSKEETFGAGAVLTEAEKSTGLLSQSWYGVPLAGREIHRPAGLMAFQSFQANAFPENRRRLMGSLAGITALHLK